MVSAEVQKLLDHAITCGKHAEEHRRQAIVHRDGYLLNAKLAGESLNKAKEQLIKETGRTRDVVGALRDEFCQQAGIAKSCFYNYRNIAKHWDFLQSQKPLPDSITQCLALLDATKGKRSDRPRNWWIWHANNKLVQGLQALWTSDASPEELDARSRELQGKHDAIIAKHAVPPRTEGTGCMADSGAFSLNEKAKEYASSETDPITRTRKQWEYYDTTDFFQYMDNYRKWVQRHQHRLSYYANLDVIGDPERTWRNQQYLETVHGLKPMPVVHFRTDLAWLRKYVDLGYEMIGFGGLKGNLQLKECQKWLTDAFNIVCDTPDRLPRVKIHGFGVSGIATLRRFPWYSVDFTTWNQLAKIGQIAVPPWKDGKFQFDKPHTAVQVSKGSPRKTADEEDDVAHHPMSYEKLSEENQRRVDEWLDYIDVYYGKETGFHGVSTSHQERREANLKYFEELKKTLPPYPQPFGVER